jgi:outer membrane usher protein
MTRPASAWVKDWIGLFLMTGILFPAVFDARADGLLPGPSGVPRPILLEVWINGQTHGHVIKAMPANNGLWASGEALSAAGIRLRPDEVAAKDLVDLDHLDGVTVEIDTKEQRALMTVIPSRLPVQVYDLRPKILPIGPDQLTDTGGTGFVFNYDAVVNGTRHKPLTAGVFLKAVLFSRLGAFNTSGVASRIGTSESRFVRLDSVLDIDQPGAPRRWQIGDAVSGGVAWSRRVRFGGLHVASDYSLQPDLPTIPLPQYSGSAVAPSTLDVFVDSARVMQTEVDTGPFDIRNLPVVTGGGEVQIVLRDMLGRETVETLSTYASSRVLRQGLMDYSVDAGFLRKGYGLSNFDYGEAVGQASLRYGLTGTVTLQMHAEVSKRVKLAGGGAVFLLPFASVQAAGALSHGSKGNGHLLSLSVESRRRPLSLFAAVTRTSRNYADIGSLYGPAPYRSRTQVGSRIALPHHGSLSASLISLTPALGNSTDLLATTYSQPLGRGVIFSLSSLSSLSSLRNRQTRNWSLQAFFSLALGDHTTGSAAIKSGPTGSETQGALSRPADPDGGFGYNLQAIDGAVQAQEVALTWVKPSGQFGMGVSSVNGQVTARANASGSLIAMDEGLYLARQTGDAFAVVRTGRPDVKIYRENRPAAVSDRDGKALLVDLSPYSANRIAVDPADYPIDTVVRHTDRIVMPRRFHGLIVDLSPQFGRPMLIAIHFEDGSFPVPGSLITFEGRQVPQVVGRNGQVFFADLQAGQSGLIETPEGVCRFFIEPSATPVSISVAQPVTCIKIASHAP